jgi:hypothetical protein
MRYLMTKMPSSRHHVQGLVVGNDDITNTRIMDHGIFAHSERRYNDAETA